MQTTATDAITSIVASFVPSHFHQLMKAYVQGEPGLAPHDPAFRGTYPPEIAERRLALACDKRATLPVELLERGLEHAIHRQVPLLEAQVHRAIGLTQRDAASLSTAIEMWERAGALPNLGRARAERGLVTGDAAETEAGLAILRKVGDANYVDRFTALV